MRLISRTTRPSTARNRTFIASIRRVVADTSYAEERTLFVYDRNELGAPHLVFEKWAWNAVAKYSISSKRTFYQRQICSLLK